MDIAVDFDGTIVEHAYPGIGKEIEWALVTMKEWQEAGHRVFLWSGRPPEDLKKARQWLEDKGVPLWYPIYHGKATEKAVADLYIDDRAVGCPKDAQGRVDWIEVRRIVNETKQPKIR